jgi:hypothetical protein
MESEIREAIKQMFERLRKLPIPTRCEKCGGPIFLVHRILTSAATEETCDLRLPICPKCDASAITSLDINLGINRNVNLAGTAPNFGSGSCTRKAS